MAAATAQLPPLEFLQVVADPVRWELLLHLGRSDRRVGELAALVGRAQNLVSYHLGELRSAGLVSARRSSADGRDTYYRLDPAGIGAHLEATGAALHPALALGASADGARPPARRRAPRVLFLCTGNSARSQMAEAFLEHRLAGRVEACSAGSHPKVLHPNAVRVMAERGIDIAERTAKHLDRFSRSRFDHVITLCDKVREVCPELPGSPVTAHWSMADPSAAGDDDDVATYPTFVATADEIEVRVDLLVAELTVHPEERSPHAC